MKSPQRAVAIAAIVSIAVLAAAIPAFMASSGEGANRQGATSFDAGVERTESLVTATFTTPEGDQIRMYSPTVGATVSGMVVAEVNSKDPGEQESRGSKLRSYIIDVEGQRTPVSKGSWNWKVPAVLTGGYFICRLLDGDGKEVSKTPVYAPQPPAQPPGTSFDPPKYCGTGTAPVVDGPFNGNVGDTAVKWNGTPAYVLAESESMAVIQPLPGSPGQGKLDIEDNGIKSSSNLNLLKVDLSTDAPRPMMRGTRAVLNVLVTGLNGLTAQDKIGLRLQLNSDNIRWANQPDRVVLTPLPTGGGSNEFRQNLTFAAIATGAFEIEAVLCDSTGRHGDYTSKEEVHPWEVSALGPEHKEAASEKFKHTDALSARTAHTLDASQKDVHDGNVSRRQTSQRYNQVHHGEALSTKNIHTQRDSMAKVHHPAVSKSERPTHTRESSRKRRHEEAWSKSSDGG